MNTQKGEQFFVCVLAAILLIGLYFFLSDLAEGGTLYDNGFDNTNAPLIKLDDEDPLKGKLYAFPYPLDFESTLMSPKGGCWRRSDGAPFDVWAYSTHRVFSGDRSWRTEVHTNYPNNMSAAKCQVGWVHDEHKNRNEISIASAVYGSWQGPEWGNVPNGSDAQWYAYALFIPSDEGTYLTWVNGGERSIITQFMASGNSSTPETHFMIGGSSQGKPKIDVEMSYSTNPNREELQVKKWNFLLEPDEWHTILVRKVRDYTSRGSFKMWLDCPNWKDDTCAPIISVSGPVSIADKPVGSFSLGDYESHVDTNKVRVLYFDALKISDKNATFAEAASGLIAGGETLPEKPKAPTWGDNMENEGRLQLTWELPTKRTDGSDLPVAEIDHSTVYWECNGKTGSRDVPAPTTIFMAGLPTTEICNYTLTATDVNSLTSELSATYTFDPNAIEPPETEITLGGLMLFYMTMYFLLLIVIVYLLNEIRKQDA